METWKMEWQEMIHQVRKHYKKTLYTMNLHLHMHLHILQKCTEMSKNIVLTYSDIWIYINTRNIYIYMWCHKKGQVWFVRQYHVQYCV